MTEQTTNQANLEDLYELSPMQQGMLFHTLYAPGSGIYFEQSVFTIEGDFNRLAFRRAWQQVVNRHSILRTGFMWEGLEKPLQIVYRNVNIEIEEEDWRELDAERQHDKLENFIRDDQVRGFDLSRPPLLRLTLFRTADRAYKFVWSRHHLVLDRWSRSLVLKDFFTFYDGLSKGVEPEVEETRPYVDYIAWLLKQDQSAAEFFWRRSLEGFEKPTEIRFGKTPALQHETYDQQSVRLSSELSASLRRFAREQKLTMYTLVQGAWSLLLSRYSGDRRVLFGATVSGRPAELAHVEGMVGLFINTLPIPVRIQPQMSLASWLRSLQEKQAEQRQYEYSSLVDIQGWSEVPRGLPLFETILVFENLPVETSFSERESDLIIRGDRGVGSKANYPLTMIVNPAHDLSVQVVYDRSRFEPDSITLLLNHFLVLLENFCDAAERSVGEISLLDSRERDQLLRKWNETSSPFLEKCIHELFEVQAEQRATSVALRCDSEEVTYAQLNERANRLAHYLRGSGVGPEVRVAICAERSVDMIVGLLGILKAGGTYVPLEPTYPSDRISFILTDCQAQLLLTQQRLGDLFSDATVDVIYLDGEAPPFMSDSVANPVAVTGAENSAHVIYTSGSTGQPKGVVSAHRASVNRFVWMWQQYPFVADEVCCQKTSLSFVDSIWEIFGPLLQGVPLVIIPDEVVKDPRQFVHALSVNKVSRLVLVPSLLRVMLETEDLSRELVNLRYCVCSGETLPVELATMFRQQLPKAKLINLYGSSEVAADVTCYEVQATDKLTTIPIGRPIANTEVYLLDSDFQPAPVGVMSEIYIGGDGLARGYLNRPDLTAEKFVPHPFSTQPGARLFQTGDVGLYLPDGTIEYRGRRDHQVKLRGFRIELGEIEAQLASHPQVKQTVVVASDSEQGDKYLVAYLVLKAAETITIEEMRSHLQQSLPEYMIPSAFVLLDEFPLTTSGKVDRRQLPAADEGRLELGEQFVAPRTPVEQEVAHIWEQVLKVKGVGVNDNFFALGGHSLLATQVISRVNESLQIEMPLRTMFEQPTVAGLALAAAQRQAMTLEDETMQLLSKLSELSDEEAQQLLESEILGASESVE